MINIDQKIWLKFSKDLSKVVFGVVLMSLTVLILKYFQLSHLKLNQLQQLRNKMLKNFGSLKKLFKLILFTALDISLIWNLVMVVIKNFLKTWKFYLKELLWLNPIEKLLWKLNWHLLVTIQLISWVRNSIFFMHYVKNNFQNKSIMNLDSEIFFQFFVQLVTTNVKKPNLKKKC